MPGLRCRARLWLWLVRLIDADLAAGVLPFGLDDPTDPTMLVPLSCSVVSPPGTVGRRAATVSWSAPIGPNRFTVTRHRRMDGLCIWSLVAGGRAGIGHLMILVLQG